MDFIPAWLNGIYNDFNLIILHPLFLMTHESQTVALSLSVFDSVPGQIDKAAKGYLRVYNTLDKLVDLIRISVTDPAALADLDQLQRILKGTGDNDDPDDDDL